MFNRLLKYIRDTLGMRLKSMTPIDKPTGWKIDKQLLIYVGHRTNLIYGKTYLVTSNSNDCFYIIDSYGIFYGSEYKSSFVTLEEFRQQQIDKLIT